MVQPKHALIPAARLPMRWNSAILSTEVRGLPDACWQVHRFNQPHRASDAYMELTLRDEDGPRSVMTSCPYLATALRTFPARIRHARLARLAPGMRITSHVDRHGPYRDDDVILHAVVTSNPRAQLIVGRRQYRMTPGELWFIDTYCLHSLANRGTGPRVHLILGCKPDGAINAILGFDITEYRRRNLFTHHDQYVRFMRREQRWQRLRDGSTRASKSPAGAVVAG
jgi:hypothetical protein